MEKNYKVRICFGDGKPVETALIAKSGIAAQDQVMQKYPGARSVHILSAEIIAPPPPKPKKPVEVPIQRPDLVVESKPSALFTDLTVDDVRQYIVKDNDHKAKLLRSVIEMKREGLSHRKIAATLGIGSTTVGTWLKQCGPL